MFGSRLSVGVDDSESWRGEEAGTLSEKGCAYIRQIVTAVRMLCPNCDAFVVLDHCSFFNNSFGHL